MEDFDRGIDERINYKDVKSMRTTVPFVKDNELDYSKILPFIPADYTWIIYVAVVIFIVAPIVIALALLVGALFNPPPYIHLILWIPTTLILSLLLLPPFKGVLVAQQYRHDAHEGHQ